MAKPGKGKRSMLMSTLVMAGICTVLLIYAYSRGDGSHVRGTVDGLKMLWSIVPLLLFALIIAGLIPHLIPKEVISRWLGESSGARGLFTATLLGALTPGGPYVSIPMVAGFMNAGVDVGVLTAYLASWSLLSVLRIPMEAAFVGWEFTIIRTVASLFAPAAIGLVTRWIYPYLSRGG